MVRKKKGGLYEYLDKIGVLQTEDDALIKEAKKKYWSEYKRKWKQQKRKAETVFTVYLKASEVRIITIGAKKHKRSKTAFLKQAALSYAASKYLVPDVLAVNEIKELLIMTYAGIQELFDENIMAHRDGKELLRRVEALEGRLLQLLEEPRRLEEYIANQARTDPGCKEALLKLLQTL